MLYLSHPAGNFLFLLITSGGFNLNYFTETNMNLFHLFPTEEQQNPGPGSDPGQRRTQEPETLR